MSAIHERSQISGRTDFLQIRKCLSGDLLGPEPHPLATAETGEGGMAREGGELGRVPAGTLLPGARGEQCHLLRQNEQIFEKYVS